MTPLYGKHAPIADLPTDKVRGDRLRRMATRYGPRLVKSPHCDPNAIDYRRYALIDVSSDGAINRPLANQFTCNWTLQDVERHLTS